MTNYIWNCRTVDVFPTYESETDVVYNVHWSLQASEQVDGKTYEANVYGTQSIAIDLADFVPFADLTNEMVTGWVEAAMGEESVQSLKDSLNLAIESQINPTSIPLTIQN